MIDLGAAERRVLAERGLTVPVGMDHSGRLGPTHWATRSGGWRRSSHGYYVPARVELTPDQRILEAGMALPEYGGITGWAALRWRRARWFEGDAPHGLNRPVWLATAGDHVRPQPGIAVSAERLDPRDLEVVEGLPLTTAVRSTWFEMRYAADARAAAIVLSMAAYSDLVSIDELAEFSFEHPGWTGAPRCRAGVKLAYENCWSPTEVDVAITWEVEADLPRLRCNEPLFDRFGRHLGTPDFLDVEAGLVIEYEGPHHLRATQRARDIGREELFRRHGLAYMTILRPHLSDRWALVARMQAARRRSSFSAESVRRWTNELPTWWVATHTVALRRQLTDSQRVRLLGYRDAA